MSHVQQGSPTRCPHSDDIDEQRYVISWFTKFATGQPERLDPVPQRQTSTDGRLTLASIPSFKYTDGGRIRDFMIQLSDRQMQACLYVCFDVINSYAGLSRGN